MILLLVVLSSVKSCDWLELLPPDGLVFDEYWKTKEDVEATLLGAYSKFAIMDEKLFLYGEIRADMIDADEAPNYEKQIINSSIFSNNILADWMDFYEIINYCNNVIELAPKMYEENVDPTFTEFQMVSLQSEAIFLRSLAYFYLVRVFKDVPYITQPTIDDNIDFYVPKTPGDSILLYVVEDLKEFSLSISTDYGSNEKTKGRATKGALNALLADISLWNFQYEDCLEYIQNIDSLNQYYLMTSTTWFDIFQPGNSLESIFELQFDGNGQNNSLYDYTYNLDYYVSSPNAIRLLDPELSRERIRGFGSISTDFLEYKPWKYAGVAPDQKTARPSAIRKAANFIIYRYADIVLMKAEAYSQLGMFNEAEEEINKIRSRALMEPLTISTSEDAFEDAILEERAKEFAFEGKRWFDLMRMGRRNDFQRKNILIEIIIQDANSTQRLVLASKLSDPNGWYLPIYEDELERNANLVQNSYYVND